MTRVYAVFEIKVFYGKIIYFFWTLKTKFLNKSLNLLWTIFKD